MSFRTIIELTEHVCRESKDETKLQLLEELRKILNEEGDMLRANIETFFPHAGKDPLQGDRSNGEEPMPDPQSLRKRAEELRMKAMNLIREADALALRAENLEKATAKLQGRVDKAREQAA
jgi:hypothetical protein